ncbi:lymphatic vessel endothelial hyaluronic receptor 1b [Symphorus nematophorus]
MSAGPQSPRAAGVFLLIEGGKYTFNFTAARDACLFMNVTIATRAQMARAVQHGLEMCKFGWTAEQIAIIPRITPDKNCGQGKTGVVTWYASTNAKFGVFCFNASAEQTVSSSERLGVKLRVRLSCICGGVSVCSRSHHNFEETPNRSTASPHSFTLSATLTVPTRTSTSLNTPLIRSTTKSPPSRKPRPTKVPEQTSFTSAFTLLVKTTNSTRIPSASTTLKTFSTHIPTSLSHLITSKPAVVSLAFSTSVHASNSSGSSESVTLPSVIPTKPPLGDVPTALIILGIVILLLTAAGIVWYHKLNNLTFWPQGQQKDDIETEMWKHTDSEMDLHSQHEAEEEEELDRKYSSDVTLCVNPDTKTNSSE